MKTWKKLVFVTALSASLSGCIAVGAAAVGAAAATIIYDRRTIKTTLDDQNLSYNISRSIQADQELSNQTHIIVASFNRMVLLAGQAPTRTLRNRAVRIAKQYPGIDQIYNEISLESPPSALTTTSDGWITSKIRTEFLATAHLNSAQFKVVTDNGIVYLMGIVTRSQADKAVHIARRVAGVQKVVKIFKYTPATIQQQIDERISKTKKVPTKKKTVQVSYLQHHTIKTNGDLEYNQTAGTI